MLAKTYSYGINGLDAYPVTIEVDVSNGLPLTNIVGLPDSALRESKERVRASIKNSGYKYPMKRVTVNMSPAHTKKEGPSFDLAIALGILTASGEIDLDLLDKYVLCGELSLDGKIQPITGALSIALGAAKNNFKSLIIPSANALESSFCKNINIFPVKKLDEAILLIDQPKRFKPYKRNIEPSNNTHKMDIDFSDVKGQTHVKRGLEIAASGGHNILMVGPPGSGKSMLAKRFSTILPDMTYEETLETTKIHSVMGLLKSNQNIMSQRPFRSPHHTTSDVAIVGGGSSPKPGEVTMSHNGVLFLDELPEFNRNVLESLRQPLEDHQVTISRAIKTVCYPAKFILIGAMNPCPCGWYTDSKKECRCTSIQVQRYMSKVSGPLLDRMDIHLDVPSLDSEEMMSSNLAETSKSIKERTTNAFNIQRERFKNTLIKTNAQMNNKLLKKYCPLTIDGKKLLKDAIELLGLTARSYDKVLKVARTIADLNQRQNIIEEDICEAIQYRQLDRK